MAKRWVATDFGDVDVLELQDHDVPDPTSGEVRITVKAVGMNPVDHKMLGRETDRSKLPMPIGYEVSGVIDAIGPDTEIASGGGAVDDEVIAYRIQGGYATQLLAPAKDVFAKPATLEHPAAANLLLASATAADMLRVTPVKAGET